MGEAPTSLKKTAVFPLEDRTLSPGRPRSLSQETAVFFRPFRGPYFLSANRPLPLQNDEFSCQREQSPSPARGYAERSRERAKPMTNDEVNEESSVCAARVLSFFLLSFKGRYSKVDAAGVKQEVEQAKY